MRIFICLSLLSFLILCEPRDVGSETYIRKIRLKRLNVFDKELEHENNFIYKTANRLHIVTRERVIRRELLVREGEPFDSMALYESAKNIRALPFIGEVYMDIKNASGDSVDVDVTTEDLWTTVVGISGEGGGGRYVVSLYADEKNIAGLGMAVETTLKFASDDDNGFSIHAYDNRFLGTRLFTDVWCKDFTFDEQLKLFVSYPFYKIDTRWSFSCSFNRLKLRKRLFHDGKEFFRYRRDITSFLLKGIRAFGKFNRIEPYLQYVYNDNDYGIELMDNPYNVLIPEDEVLSGPGLGFKIYTLSFATARYLDEFGTTEDLNKHLTFDINTTWSGPTFKGDYEAALLEIKSGFLQEPIANVYTGFKNIYSCYCNGSTSERIINKMETAFYFKPSTYHLLAVRYLSAFAWQQQPDYQLVLGGNNGLRGYSDRYFDGCKLALFNFEYRLFTPIEIFTVGLGAVAFFDAGYVWDDHERVKIDDLRSDFGLGLRFGLTKSSTARTVRLDMAWSSDMSDWYISFGTGNLFELARFK